MTSNDSSAAIGFEHKLWAGADEIPAFKLGGTWRFRRADLDEWIDKRIGQGGDAAGDGA